MKDEPVVQEYLKAGDCPAALPRFADFDSRTIELHTAIDNNGRRRGAPYLHPTDPTVQLDLLGSKGVIDWQEGKSAAHFLGEHCWSELPPLYGRYATRESAALLAEVKRLEGGAKAAVVTDCGMQAVALLFDAVVQPGDQIVMCRQVYNKTRVYAERVTAMRSGSLAVVDDGDVDGLREAFSAQTALVFAETFTNPLMRAQDIPAMRSAVDVLRRGATAGTPASRVKLAIDSTIATPWSLRQPLLGGHGVDVVVAAGTKALGGQDRDMWGYIATNDVRLGNAVMDLQAMRGGILDWRRSAVVAQGLTAAKVNFTRRCESAVRISEFLTTHPSVSEIYHPSLDEHPDAAAIARDYQLHGSLVSLRVVGATEDDTRHFCDVLAMTKIFRYALSFDGLCSKVNHHRSVSEYFTPPPVLKKLGFDRLIRLAIGIEDANDLIAALNWALCHHREVSKVAVAEFQAARAQSLR